MATIYMRKAENVWFGVAFSGKRILATSFGPTEKGVLASLKYASPRNVQLKFSTKDSSFGKEVVAALKDVYDGKNVVCSFLFETTNLSNYFKKVVDTVCQIPQGYVASYGGVAQAVGGSPRAVGRVMALNPFAPLCPCHRVVASDFTLCGYGGGLHAKLAFLRRERKGYSEKKEIALDKAKLELFPVEFVLKKAEKDKARALC